jgi:hypothetical protein
LKLPPQYVTKFVSKKYFDATRTGFLKFGTLAEYRLFEIGAENRLTDREEGEISWYANRHLKNYSANFFGGGVRNISTSGNIRPISVVLKFEAFVFCSTIGPYDRDTHAEIRSHNESLSSWVVFDTHKLWWAIETFFSDICPPNGRMYGSSVEYRSESKDEGIAPEKLESVVGLAAADSKGYGDAFRKAAFEKHRRYQHEREYRIVVWPDPPHDRTKAIFVETAEPRAAPWFARAVVDAGES